MKKIFRELKKLWDYILVNSIKGQSMIFINETMTINNYILFINKNIPNSISDDSKKDILKISK
mgnify:CR=1 FL=1